MPVSPHITLWSHGLNPWKVDIILRELNLSYETRFVISAADKPAEFLKDFPNGRFPAIIDHDNGDFKTWESNAIIEYLLERYGDRSKNSINIDTQSLTERQLAREWLSFQNSGQGVAFQDAAFWKFQSNNVSPFALERSLKELERIVAVLDRCLKQNNSQGLIGNRITFVDLVWFWWDEFAITTIAPHIDYKKSYPYFLAWHEKLKLIPSIEASQAFKKQQ